MSFSENLKRARQRIGLTQQQIADTLGITKSTYCGYETGKRQPDIPKLRRLSLLLCTSVDELLGLAGDDPSCTVTSHEYEQVLQFRRLSPEGQRMVRIVFEEEKSRSLLQKSTSTPEDGPALLRIATQPAGCGEEVYLGPDGFRTAFVRRDALPEEALFALPVCGSSLEPRFHNGDVLVLSQSAPQPGQAGVFLRGCLGCVRLMGYGELLGLSPVEPPVPLDETIRPCGTIVGVLSQEDILS